jgi:hypothetical protein
LEVFAEGLLGSVSREAEHGASWQSLSQTQQIPESEHGD